ncbi:MAG: SIS domain-containing protein [Eubacteriales bacterium]
MTYTDKYFDTVIAQLERVRAEQTDHIRAAAAKVVATVSSGGRIYFFGCTHAGILAQESFYRTGGLAVINPIFPPGLTCDVTPVTMTSALERQDGYGKIIADAVGFNDGDMLFIHSVSGRNSVPVELACEAVSRGVYTVAITNMDYSAKSASRHANGMRLFEAADLVIDDCGVFGDAAIQVDGFAGLVSPTSTVTGAAIVNSICAETIPLFIEAGIDPPVFMSANIDGGDAYNAKIMEKYKDKITYLN